jgi:hypothetical protein
MVWAVDPTAAPSGRTSRYIRTDARDISVSPSGLFFVDPGIDLDMPVPVGIYFLPDDLTAQRGYGGFIQGKGPDFTTYMRPDGQPAAPLPPAGAGYKPCRKISLMFQEYGGPWELAVITDTGIRFWDRILRTIRRMRGTRDNMLMRCQLKSARSVATQYNTTVYATEAGLMDKWSVRPTVLGDATVHPSVLLVGDPRELLRESRPGADPFVIVDELFADVDSMGERRVPRAAIQDTGVRMGYDPALDDPPKDPDRPHFDPNLDDEVKF